MPQYQQIKRLGQGAFGEVWLVRDQALGVNRAVKFVLPTRITSPSEFYSEPRTLKALQHERIVSVEDAGRLDDGRLYIAMEYLPNGSVEDESQGGVVPLRRAISLACDVCWGLEFAHQKNYIHRDIKPANILIGKDRRGKLSDFGLATKTTFGMAASPQGYLTHLAPEVFTEQKTNALTDIYALGVTLYRFVNGDAYLPSVDFPDLETAITEGWYPDRSKYRMFVPRQLRTILNRAMNVDPTKRYRSASSLRLALESIPILLDWEEQEDQDGYTWVGSGSSLYARAQMRKVGKTWEFTVTKGVQESTARRVLAECRTGLSKGDVVKHAHDVLARLTVKK